MKKHINMLPFIGSCFTILVLAGACTNDEAVPLREPIAGEGEKFTFTWEETADSIQNKVYSTYLGSEGTFNENNTGSSNFHYWPNAHALHYLVDGYSRTGTDSYISKMKALVRGIKNKNGGTYSNVFNDDMLWLGNATVRAFEATNDQEYKEVAEFLWKDVIASHSDVFGGGITWKKDTPKQKNAVSNGPAIILAMRLYALDGDSDYLDWAKQLYQWQKNTLVDPVSGLVWDNISEENGEVTINKEWIFTYNIGTWIGSGIRLFQATGDQVYLDDALKSARSMIKSPKLTTEGLMRDEGQGDGGLFKGILVRYFTELIQLSDLNSADRKTFVDFLRYNAATLYSKGIKRPQMLTGPNWGKMPDGNVDLTTQLSGAMLIEAAAILKSNKIFE
ncbi:glycoside hydrolase family 88 protein [Arenibacter algicola]|uniref:glycoside hydrolase family 76 protein n=1 Tax=Arenibacter algicola TaxID=616991 RepID=UPI001C06C395|nr:glycoside hydrolase family 76 protein [Arenibacter algicola]MBU2906704.1 glycoside hydrolase family 88 protein [Arenibacter algicola]